MSVIIDGAMYDIRISNHNTEAEQIDKYAERTVNGDLLHEPLGTYYIFTLEFEPIHDPALHERFYQDLTAPIAERTVTIPGVLTTNTFKCYIRVEKVQMRRHKPTGNTYEGIVAKFIPISPARRN